MVTYRYLERKFLKPQQEKLRAEGRVEGKAEGRVEGKVEGKAEGRVEGRVEGKVEGKAEGRVEGSESMRRLWEDWNRRREEAEARGEPFAELPPGR